MRGKHSWKSVGADDIDLAALQGQEDVVGALVAEHDLELGAAVGVERPRKDVGGRAAPGGAHRELPRPKVRRRLDAGRSQRRADVDIRGEAADIMKIRSLHL